MTNALRIPILILGLLATAVAQGQETVYETGFEDPPFAKGSQLRGQDGWSDAIPPFLNAAAGVISDGDAAAGKQSLRVAGADLVSSGGETDPFDAVGSYRRPVEFDAGAKGLPLVRLRTDVRLGGPRVDSADSYFSASLAARSSGDDGYAELEIASNGVLTAYSSLDGDVVATAPVALDAWHTLGIDVDYAGNAFTFLLDGVSLGTFPFAPANTSDVLARGALVTYAQPDNAGLNFARANYTASFDNFSITAVPEPSTAVQLAVLGCLAALSRQRRRS